MYPLTERDVIVGLARDIELFRILELRGIAIRRSHDHQCKCFRRKLGPAQLHRLICKPNGRLHRTVVTQHLFDRAREHRGVSLERVELFGISPERERPVANQIGRRLVARDQQQRDETQQVRARHRIAPVMRRDQRADQVGSRIDSPLFDLGGEVVAQFIDHANCFGRRRRARNIIIAANQTVRPTLESCVQLRGHAEHLRDHRDRQHVGEIRHQLELALGLHLVE